MSNDRYLITDQNALYFLTFKVVGYSTEKNKEYSGVKGWVKTEFV